jgi:hypothetical protein
MDIGPDADKCRTPPMRLSDLGRDYPFHVLAAAVVMGILLAGIIRVLL